MKRPGEMLKVALKSWPLDSQQELFIDSGIRGIGDETAQELVVALRGAELAAVTCANALAEESDAAETFPSRKEASKSSSRSSPMRFRPLHDRIVVKRIDAEERTAGGIIIPDAAKEKPSQGEVVAVGPGGRDENGKLLPIDLRIGDRVLFGKWSGTEVTINGQELLIMRESDVMGTITEVDVARAIKGAA